jgi:prevent-host-death family protein
MKKLGSFEAKTHFSEILREVERGETFEILRRNKPVAHIVGIRGTGRDVPDMIRRIRKLRRSIDVTAKDIHEWIQEGRA